MVGHMRKDDDRNTFLFLCTSRNTKLHAFNRFNNLWITENE